MQIPQSDDHATLFQTFHQSACFAGKRRAVVNQLAGHEDEPMSYQHLHQQVQSLALNLINLCALQAGERVILLADNRPQWLIASLAIQATGAIEVPQDPSLPAAELIHYLHRLKAVIAIVDDRILAQALLQLRSTTKLRYVLLLNDDPTNHLQPELLTLSAFPATTDSQPNAESIALDPLLQSRQSQITADDAAVMIRTSGTTGTPKVVILSHRNLLHSQKHLPLIVNMQPTDRLLLCLPLWHLYGRIAAYMSLGCGAQLHLSDMEHLQSALISTQPQYLPSLPLVWERIHHQSLEKIDDMGAAAPLLRIGLAASRTFLSVRDRFLGRTYCDDTLSRARRAINKTIAAAQLCALVIPYLITRLALYGSTQKALGGKLKAAIIGDAPLPRSVDEGLRALGLNILEGYGSTEQMVSAVRRPGYNLPGTVGLALPEVKIRIIDDSQNDIPYGTIGEIAVAGPQICIGYLNELADCAEVFPMIDDERHHLTGDMGRMDQNGNLQVIGRKKHRFSLPDSQYIYPEFIYPEWIENHVLESRYVLNALLYPDANDSSLPKLVLLVVPDFYELFRQLDLPDNLTEPDSKNQQQPAAWSAYLEDNQHSLFDWLKSPTVVAFFNTELRKAWRQTHPRNMPAVQRPDGFQLLSRQFRIGDEMTPTLKMRRKFIVQSTCKNLAVHPLQV